MKAECRARREVGPGIANREAKLGKTRTLYLLAREVEQWLGAARVTQLGQRLLLELTDPLAGQAQRAADLVQRVRVAVVQAEPHGHDRGLTRGQRVERRTQLLGHQLTVHQLRGLGRVDVLDEVADGRLAVLADGGVKRDRLTRRDRKSVV